MINNLYTAKWKYAKKWVYSVTFDEALSELHQYVIPICQKYGVPGHIEAVSSQMGQERKIGSSSYNGLHHMTAAQMREMIKMGWGVGSHSHTHEVVLANPKDELGMSKKLIEDAIGVPVNSFVAPGSNANLTEEVQKLLPEYGYLAGYGITDRLNKSENDNMYFLGRVPLHEKYWGTFDADYDEFKRIAQAEKENGWIVDYCHCPMPKAVHDYKDCTSDHFDDRLKAVVDFGKNNVWLANPDDVTDYIYTKKYIKLKKDLFESNQSQDVYILEDTGLPTQTVDRSLTFIMDTWLTPESVVVTYNGNAVVVQHLESCKLFFTVTAKDGGVIKISGKHERL